MGYVQAVDADGREIDHITSRLIMEKEGYVDITIGGPAGIGKTILAWEIKKLVRNYMDNKLPKTPSPSPRLKGARIFEGGGDDGDGVMIAIHR